MNYTYRFLEADDFSQFINLYKEKGTFMNEKISPEEHRKYIDRLAWLFVQPDYKSVGCFIGDKLVALCNGRFYPRAGTWYSHGQCFNLPYTSLNQYREFSLVFANLGRKLTDYAESIGIYQFYMAREINEGIAFYKLHTRTVSKGEAPLDVRYMVFPDRIYRKGDAEILEQHKFFFRPDNEVKKDIFVSMFVLKPEFRENILRINQQP